MNRKYSILLVRLVVCCLFLSLTSTISAQSDKKASAAQAEKLFQEAEELYNQSQYAAALTKYEQVRLICLQHHLPGELLVYASFSIGSIFQIQEKFDKAIAAYKESLTFRQAITPAINPSYFETFVLIGSNFWDLNNYDSAYVYFTKAEKLLARYPTINELVVMRLYNEMGLLFDAYGNYSQSINYYEKALSILKHQPVDTPDKVDRYVRYSNNIALSLRKLGRYREALVRFKDLIQYEKYPAILYFNVAKTYLLLQQYDSAFAYLNKIESLPNINATIDYNNSLGLAYLKTNNPEKALRYLQKASQLSRNTFGSKNVNLALSYEGKGQVYEAQRNFAQALTQYQSALRALHFSFDVENIYQNPTDWNNTVSGLHLFEVLKFKAHAFRSYFRQTKQAKDLEASLQTYQSALRLADRIRKSYDSDEAKLFFTNTIFPVYEQAIGTAFQLYGQTRRKDYLERAFAFAEQSKAAVLAESVRDLEIKHIPGIPASLLQQERKLKQEITRVSLRLVEEKDSAKRIAYQETIRNDEIELLQRMKEFEANPQYYQLKYDTSSVKISELRKLVLDDKTALVEYFLGKDQAYAFVVTRNGLEARQLPVTDAFRLQLSQLQKALYSLKSGATYQGDRPAFALYQQLLQPLASSLQGIERLVVIPDAELSYIPFEALVTEAASGRYLIEDYTISYAYSGTLLRNALSRHSGQQATSLLAMAPFATPAEKVAQLRNNPLSPLAASKEEVERIGGKIYLDNEATKDLFTKNAGSYGVIHLATHAQADNNDPLQSFIAFYPRNADSLTNYRLYTPELYNLSLTHVRLVVLSACETGSGQLVRGEGVMSLARAFAYAGCPNIVTTLWKADDQATADISAHMHHYLKGGKAKDEALRLSKLDYLNQAKGRKRAPFYWANFIFIGDRAPLYHDTGWIGWLAGGVLALVVLGIIYRKRLVARATLPQRE